MCTKCKFNENIDSIFNIKKIKEMKLKEYRIKIQTFRQCLQVLIGDVDQSLLQELGYGNIDFSKSKGAYVNNDGANIIWLREYDLSVLVHELTHFVQSQIQTLSLEEDKEAPAYIMEEAFTKIMYLTQGKNRKYNFKEIEEFYFDNEKKGTL